MMHYRGHWTVTSIVCTLLVAGICGVLLGDTWLHTWPGMRHRGGWIVAVAVGGPVALAVMLSGLWLRCLFVHLTTEVVLGRRTVQLRRGTDEFEVPWDDVCFVLHVLGPLSWLQLGDAFHQVVLWAPFQPRFSDLVRTLHRRSTISLDTVRVSTL